MELVSYWWYILTGKAVLSAGRVVDTAALWTTGRNTFAIEAILFVLFWKCVKRRI